MDSYSPTSSLDKDEVTNDTPVDETVQSPPANSDAVNESTQNDKPNKVYQWLHDDVIVTSFSNIQCY